MRYALKLVFLMLLSIPSAAVADGKRVALVIGNSAYENTAPLVNPRNDAQDISTSLSQMGFEVIDGRDLNLRGMHSSLERFARTAHDSEAALIFYAGHGLQRRGENFLVPVDAKLQDDISVDYQTLHIDEVLKALDRAPGVRILILDACRNLPLKAQPGAEPSFKAGFAKFDARRNMVLAYATGANEVAYDGVGRNSTFTTFLLKHIQKPGIEIGELFRGVAAEVSSRTVQKQVPEVSRTLAGTFYFNKGETDAQFWARVRNSRDPAEFRVFLDRYPDSFLVEDAKSRITALERDRQDRGQPAREESAQGRENFQKPQAVPGASGSEPMKLGRTTTTNAHTSQGPPQDGRMGPVTSKLNVPQPIQNWGERPRDDTKAQRVPMVGTKQGSTPPQLGSDDLRTAAEQLTREQVEAEEQRLRQEFAASQKRKKPAAPPKRSPELELIEAEEQQLRQEVAKRSSTNLSDRRSADAPSARHDSRSENPNLSVTRGQTIAQLREDTAPSANPALTRTAQEELVRIGCYSGPINGILDSQTRVAMRRWSHALDRTDLGDHVTEDFVRQLMASDENICSMVAP